jgi:hypothetical protein
MFGLERYLLVEEGFTNVVKNDQVVGFRIQVGLPYYRAIPLSCVEDIELKVDGEAIDKNDIQFEIRDKLLNFTDLPSLFEDWWCPTDKAALIIKKPGGLKAGEHNVEAKTKIRWTILMPPTFAPDERPMYDTTESTKVLVLK